MADAEHSPRSAVLSRDTSAEAEQLQIEIWRRMTPLEKARVVRDLNRATLDLAMAGIGARHRDATDRERFLRLAILKLGRPLALTVYPEISQLHGL